MIGAIAGDIIGSRFERCNTTNPKFKFLTQHNHFTDDTVLSCAIAEALLTSRSYADTIREFAIDYPDRGYGRRFLKWVREGGDTESIGNGAAMRVAPIGWFFGNTEEDLKLVLEEAERQARVTHNTDEAVQGAQVIALAVHMARMTYPREAILNQVQEMVGWDLSKPLVKLQRARLRGATAWATVPVAFRSFYESWNYDDAIRRAVVSGGDTDTIACMAGAIAHAYYRSLGNTITPEDILDNYLDQRLAGITRALQDHHDAWYESLPTGDQIGLEFGRSRQYMADIVLFGKPQLRPSTPTLSYWENTKGSDTYRYITDPQTTWGAPEEVKKNLQAELGPDKEVVEVYRAPKDYDFEPHWDEDVKMAEEALIEAAMPYRQH